MKRLTSSFCLLFVSISILAARANAGVEVMRVPDGGIQPQVRNDGRGLIHMIYFKGDAAHGDVYYVRSDDGGTNFSAPLRVNSQPRSVIAIGTVRGARLTVGAGNRVHVAWMGSDVAEPKAMDKAPMLYSRINEKGDSFEPQRNLIQKHPGLDGGGAVAADADGNVYVAWHAPGDRVGESNRRVWICRSHDDGKTFDGETPMTNDATGACGCCGMEIDAAAKGRVRVLFRQAQEGINRDMMVYVSNDAGKSFKPVIDDPFKFNACVMSTGYLLPIENEALAVWETESQIRFARLTSDDAKSPAIRSVPGNRGNRKHPAVAVNKNGSFVIAWAEGTSFNKGGNIAWQMFDPGGNAIGNIERARELPASSMPAVIVTPDNAFKIIF